VYLTPSHLHKGSSLVGVPTTRCSWISLTASVARIMLSIWAFGGLLLGAAASQVMLTLFGRRHAGNYCVAHRRDAEVASAVDGNNAH